MMKHLFWLLLLPLLLWVGILTLKPIELATADLGRHLQNGQQILEHGLHSPVLYQNTYSYVTGEYPTLNHHWLFGVIAQLLYRIGGFSVLSWLAAGATMLATALVFKIASDRSSALAAAAAAFVLMPLIANRTEVRPELMSMVFLSLSLWLIDRFRQQKLSWKWLFVSLGLMQLVWVNTHIFFIFGIGIPIVFGLCSPKSEWRKWLSLTILLILVSCLNPHGVVGLLEPLTIFHGYEYQVVENQSLRFMVRRFGRPIYWYVAALFFLLFLWQIKPLWQQLRQKKLDRHLLPYQLLTMVFVLVDLRIIRLFPFTGLVALPLIAPQLHSLAKWLQPRLKEVETAQIWSLGLPLATISIVFCIASGLFAPQDGVVGFGLQPDNQTALKFLQEHVPDPIFNNYDVGGMLIFALYPDHLVYTDNRPEAYPHGFFPDQYIKPQEDDERWNALLDQYQFQSIVFYRLDATPWGQPFLIRRMAEDQWQPVYVDSSIIVLARNSDSNAALISQYGIDKSNFSGVPTIPRL